MCTCTGLTFGSLYDWATVEEGQSGKTKVQQLFEAEKARLEHIGERVPIGADGKCADARLVLGGAAAGCTPVGSDDTVDGKNFKKDVWIICLI